MLLEKGRTRKYMLNSKLGLDFIKKHEECYKSLKKKDKEAVEFIEKGVEEYIKSMGFQCFYIQEVHKKKLSEQIGPDMIEKFEAIDKYAKKQDYYKEYPMLLEDSIIKMIHDYYVSSGQSNTTFKASFNLENEIEYLGEEKVIDIFDQVVLDNIINEKLHQQDYKTLDILLYLCGMYKSETEVNKTDLILELSELMDNLSKVKYDDETYSKVYQLLDTDRLLHTDIDKEEGDKLTKLRDNIIKYMVKIFEDFVVEETGEALADFILTKLDEYDIEKVSEEEIVQEEEIDEVPNVEFDETLVDEASKEINDDNIGTGIVGKDLTTNAEKNNEPIKEDVIVEQSVDQEIDPIVETDSDDSDSDDD